MSRFDVVIVGGGPGGLSAGAQAARRGRAHVVLERGAKIADTIQRYHRGKLVMDSPAQLRLQPAHPLRFAQDTRELVLDAYEQAIAAAGVDVRLGHEVTAISGERGAFEVTALDRSAAGAGEPPRVTFACAAVIVAMGTQGNVRKLTDRRPKPPLATPGRDLPAIVYQLDDPAAFREQTIVVVGAGDSAIENALALANPGAGNTVYLVYDREGFGNARTANRAAVERAIGEKRVTFLANTTIARVEDAGGTCRLFLEGPEDRQIEAHRVICRLGADPPRDFLATAGVRFRSRDLRERPERNATFETNKAGLYVIGATGDADLIKKAMNEGFELVERLCGEPVVPMDVERLQRHVAAPLGARGATDDEAVAAAVERIRTTVPLFADVSALQLRNLLFNDCEVTRPAPGTKIFGAKEFGSDLYVILGGTVEVALGGAEGRRIAVGTGEFLGELSLFQDGYHAGSAFAGPGCVLLRVPRNRLLQSAGSAPSIRAKLDLAFALRRLQNLFEPALAGADPARLAALRARLAVLAEQAELRTWPRGQEIFREGAEADGLYVIRRGSVAVTLEQGGARAFLAFRPAGSVVGEMGALAPDRRRTATLVATAPTETVRYDQPGIVALLHDFPELVAALRNLETARLIENGAHIGRSNADDLVALLRDAGAGEATNILLIDDALCIRCNNCETACAATHQGIPRLDREAGRTYAGVHVPTTCRHCGNALCMSDCPPDVIHRQPNGEIAIDLSGCISCGNCERNCPYGVIQMQPFHPPTFLDRLLGRAPGGEHGKEFPVKCDLCAGLGGTAACETSCPTGAIVRVDPAAYLDEVLDEV